MSWFAASFPRVTQPGPSVPPARSGAAWVHALVRAAWPALLSLVLALWVAHAVDGRLDLANQAMLFLLAAVLGGFRLPALVGLGFGTLCVALFNWSFVPPRGSLGVQWGDHAALLASMLAMAWVVAGLMALLRQQAREAREGALRARQLQGLAERLRDLPDPLQQLPALADEVAAALRTLVDAPDASGATVALALLPGALPRANDDALLHWHGAVDADERAGLWLCLRQAQAFGPGTGRHDQQTAWYLPLRASGGARGACLMRLPPAVLALDGAGRDQLRAQAQAVVDVLGATLQRADLARDAEAARVQARSQALRNTLLAAISHDYRTPLSVILGAASSLKTQGERLGAQERAHLAQRIIDEVGQLDRMTENTLQLARLESPGANLRQDWESAEELAATALAHARARWPAERHDGLRVRLQPDLPLLRCDALLASQLLDNLIDNALKHNPPEAPVELLVRHQPAAPGESPATGWLVLAVRDRGAGVPPAQREAIFEAFHRGESAPGATPVRGAGVGLAVCRAIARAHGGELRYRPRAHGGSSFEWWMPVALPPQEMPG